MKSIMVVLGTSSGFFIGSHETQTPIFEDMTFGKTAARRLNAKHTKDTKKFMNSSVDILRDLAVLAVLGVLGGSSLCRYTLNPFHVTRCVNVSPA